MKNIWLDKNEIIQKLENKKLVFWGSGEWVAKTIKILDMKPEYIIDNSPNIQGDIQIGIEVVSYKSIKEDIDNYFIVITTGAYNGLIEDLETKGLKEGINFCCSPSMLNLSIRDNLFSIDQNLLFTVTGSSVSDKGGLYLYNTRKKEYKRVYEGKSRAIVTTNTGFVMVDEEKGLVIFDKELNVIKEVKLLLNAVPHGVAYSQRLQQIYVGNAGRDSISIYDANTYSHVEEIKISQKYDKVNEEQHHINDLYVDESNDMLFVSMFSFSGNWRNSIFDGGILEYDLKQKYFKSYPIVQNMWMPHSVQIIEKKLYFLDSMRGDLYEGSNKIIGNFNGFVRGLTMKENYIFIAQSSHRYFDRLKDVSLNIPLNCGIYIFDKESKASFFHNFYEFENIHSVVLY